MLKSKELDQSVADWWVYPGGEVGLRAKSGTEELVARIHNSTELMRLMLYLDAAKRLANPVGSVFIPYLPYARQDRVAVDGDPIAIHVLARILASSGMRYFDSLDVHSLAARQAFLEAGCFLNSRSPMVYLSRFLLVHIGEKKPIFLVAPDEGAREKVDTLHEELALGFNIVDVIHCKKVRDPVTGAVTGAEIERPVGIGEAELVFVDDICDGGRTFIQLARLVREQYDYGALPETRMHLFTTHGIYSQGLTELARWFKTIGSTDSFLHGHLHPQLSTIEI